MLRITCIDVVQAVECEMENRVFMQVAVIRSKRGVLRQLEMSTAIRPRLRLGLARRILPRDLICLPTSPHSSHLRSVC
jgi:hypothetical protein